MKKLVIAVALILVGAIVIFAGLLTTRVELTSLKNEILREFVAANEGEGVIAAYEGQKARVISPNMERVIWILSIGWTRTKILREMPETVGEPVEIRAGNLSIDVYKTAEGEDRVVMDYRLNNKHRYYVTEGYNSMKWLALFVRPEGEHTHTPNIALQEGI